jgi:hypothetical protein
MAKEDLSMAIHLFEEINNRKPMTTELDMVRQVQAGVILQAGIDDFCQAWDAFMNPPVPEKDVDWDAMGTDLSKWGII